MMKMQLFSTLLIHRQLYPHIHYTLESSAPTINPINHIKETLVEK